MRSKRGAEACWFSSSLGYSDGRCLEPQLNSPSTSGRKGVAEDSQSKRLYEGRLAGAPNLKGEKMALLQNMGENASPNDPVDQPGQPSLQAYSEALDRCEARKKWQEEHPSEFVDDWQQRSADYAAIERGENLLGCCGGRTFEAGESFVFKGGK